MKFYLLRPKKDLPDESGSSNPWKPWYDKTFGFIIKAESKEKAREIAQENAGNETTFREDGDYTWGNEVWTEKKYVTCKLLEEFNGENKVVIEDHHAA